MRTCKARINWIDERRTKHFAVSLLLPTREDAILLPLAMLPPDMKEGQVITIQIGRIDEGDRRC